jgi:hypothetical protein
MLFTGVFYVFFNLESRNTIFLKIKKYVVFYQSSSFQKKIPTLHLQTFYHETVSYFVSFSVSELFFSKPKKSFTLNLNSALDFVMREDMTK